jgi:hypothetical protein
MFPARRFEVVGINHLLPRYILLRHSDDFLHRRFGDI